MSSFIVPMSSLPSIGSLSSVAQPNTPQNAQTNTAGKIPFQDFLQQAVADMEQTGTVARATMNDLALGQTDDLHTGALTAIKSSTAINFTSSLVSTAIRSYNELMRMQI